MHRDGIRSDPAPLQACHQLHDEETIKTQVETFPNGEERRTSMVGPIEQVSVPTHRPARIFANDDDGKLVEYLAYFLIGSLNSTPSVLEVGDAPIMLGSWVHSQWVLSDHNINKNPAQLQFMLSFSKSLIIASKGKKPIVPRLNVPTKASAKGEGGDQT